MSRLEETETEIADLDDSYSARTYTDGYADLARTLAAEVDELRGKLAEYESECYALRAVTAEKNSDILRKRVKASDAVITKLLAMLKPDYSNDEMYRENKHLDRIYARAVAIAGRTE